MQGMQTSPLKSNTSMSRVHYDTFDNDTFDTTDSYKKRWHHSRWTAVGRATGFRLRVAMFQPVLRNIWVTSAQTLGRARIGGLVCGFERLPV